VGRSREAVIDLELVLKLFPDDARATWLIKTARERLEQKAGT